MRTISENDILGFRKYLTDSEKSQATISKYTYDVRCFICWLNGREAEKAEVVGYKQYLQTVYAPASVNSMLSSVNSFFEFLGWSDLRVKTLKIQRQTFLSSDKELSRQEYGRLLRAAQKAGLPRMYWLMQTICATGIRISELPYITVEAVKKGYADINCKGKRRHVYLPDTLRSALKEYCSGMKIKKGSVFITQSGRPIDRSYVWTEMKKLCREAGVPEVKVYPHNLRHLFARTHYAVYKDIVRLADILGHSSVNTTRIYTMESGEIHRKQVQKLGLVEYHLST